MTKIIEKPKKKKKNQTLGEKETYKYMGILEIKTINVQRREKKYKEYFRKRINYREIKLYGRNLIKGMNTCFFFFML